MVIRVTHDVGIPVTVEIAQAREAFDATRIGLPEHLVVGALCDDLAAARKHCVGYAITVHVRRQELARANGASQI